jgi:hypothetical protein
LEKRNRKGKEINKVVPSFFDLKDAFFSSSSLIQKKRNSLEGLALTPGVPFCLEAA